MKTKTITVTCPVLTAMGRNSSEGVPPRVLIQWLHDQVAKIPESEYASARVTGTEFLRLSHDHIMTAAEVQAERLATLEEGLAKLSKAFDQRTQLTAEELRDAKALLATLGAK